MTLEYLRSFRIADYAIFDISVSFIGIYLLAPILSKLFLKFGLKISLSSWLYFTLPLGILVHILVGNITGMTKDFFDPNGDYLLKIVILCLLFLGFKNIKRG